VVIEVLVAAMGDTSITVREAAASALCGIARQYVLFLLAENNG
jgi:hypothetical protein